MNDLTLLDTTTIAVAVGIFAVLWETYLELSAVISSLLVFLAVRNLYEARKT